ncbi:DNA repair protein RadA [Candidatus Falkowbacteria bacterium]|nr:DNA repair protein RadA [Candidatus Falkowbacteria bacterium]
MTKNLMVHSCSKCGAQTPKWQGRCPECGAWGTLQQQTISRREQAVPVSFDAAKIVDLQKLAPNKTPRLKTNLAELDRVLGSGIVPGSLILLGGEPGIGKSTLLLQIFKHIQSTAGSPLSGSPLLYISGEESAEQIKLRYDRMNLFGTVNFLSETNLEQILAALKQIKPALVAIDSIQTIYSDDMESEPGNIGQIRCCAAKILMVAKELNIPIILIGHITKDGAIAGPKTLEHLVDVVLYLEGERLQDARILRGIKNRFGSTNEIGVFEMTETGLSEMKNPNKIFLSESADQSGTAISCFIEGTRPFLIEIQALVTPTVFGYPQRKVSGYDLNRLQMLSAVISKRTQINLTNQDIHLNITGGIKVNDPSIDLAVCAAILSSKLDKIIPKTTLIVGEVGLGGEVRNVIKLEQRLKEAARLNFKQALAPTLLTNLTIATRKISNIKDLISNL